MQRGLVAVVDHSRLSLIDLDRARGKRARGSGAIRAPNPVSKPTFFVPLADLERGARKLTWPIPVSWLDAALYGLEASPTGEEGLLAVELSRSGSDILVRGHAEVSVTVPCVVTLEPVLFKLKPEVSLLLAPAPTESGPTAPGRGGSPKGGPRGRRDRDSKAQNPEGWNEAQELTHQDASRDTFEADKIVLDGFLREFILLELPLYPRRSDLPSDRTAATSTPPAPSTPAEVAPGSKSVDPRLLPLAELRDRLRQNKKE